MIQRLACAFASLLLISSAAFAQNEAPKPTAPPEPEGMVKLCNGKDLNGWEGNPKLWSVKDGLIRGETTAENNTKGNTFLMYVGDQGPGKPAVFTDFELRLSYKIDHGNSGVQYRSRHATEAKENAWVVAGYQAEVANSPGADGFLYHERGRGSIALVGNKTEVGEDGKPKVVGTLGDKKAIGATLKKSDWNDYVIICKGNHVVHYLNGIQTIDLVDNDPKGRCMSGILAPQIHAGPPMWVEFRDVRIKVLDAK